MRRVWSCHAQDRLASIRKLKEHVKNASISPVDVPLSKWARSGFDSSKQIVSAAEGRRSGLVNLSPAKT